MPRQLTPEHEAVVDRIVASGQYDDPEQVIDEALHLLEERERRLQWLRAELQIGLDQEARGELIDFTPEHFEELKRRALENARQGKPIRDAVKP
jgi:antitoxin ParD1/3/4